ncbi:MAG: hypothetical protein CMJ62_18285 [Planctomycetaceae bacterium]|nr:hypothetical protein [Planctomycetaceae bacterium]
MHLRLPPEQSTLANATFTHHERSPALRVSVGLTLVVVAPQTGPCILPSWPQSPGDLAANSAGRCESLIFSKRTNLG